MIFILRDQHCFIFIIWFNNL